MTDFWRRSKYYLLIFLSETIVSHLYKTVDKLSVYSSTDGGFSKHLVSFWIKIKAEYLEVGEIALKSHLLWDQLLSQKSHSDKIQWVYILNCVWYCLQLNQDWDREEWACIFLCNSNMPILLFLIYFTR